MGVAFKSNVTKIFTYANDLGFVLDVISKCIVISVFSLSDTKNKSENCCLLTLISP